MHFVLKQVLTCCSGVELSGTSDTVGSDASGSEVELSLCSVSGSEAELAGCSVSEIAKDDVSLATVLSDDVDDAVESDGSTSSCSTLSPPSTSSIIGAKRNITVKLRK